MRAAITGPNCFDVGLPPKQLEALRVLLRTPTLNWRRIPAESVTIERAAFADGQGGAHEAIAHDRFVVGVFTRILTMATRPHGSRHPLRRSWRAPRGYKSPSRWVQMSTGPWQFGKALSLRA